MESHPYTKTRGVGPVTTQLTPGAQPASSKVAGAPGPGSCSPTCRAWSESSMPSFTDSTSTGAGCTCTPCNTGAGSTWSPCNNCRATPSAFFHQQLDVTTGATFASGFALRLILDRRQAHLSEGARHRPQRRPGRKSESWQSDQQKQ